ncbi:MAG: gamma-glutamyl-gamma-aminobutyrate hydrolase family protein [Alphaproteobacteria bacterium]
MRKPVIGIPCCYGQGRVFPSHMVAGKYVRVVREALDAIPLLIPATGHQDDVEQLADRIDGLLVPGSPSMILPRYYEGPDSEPGTEHDPARDATTLPLLREMIKRGLPFLAICRGLQEVNVAMGGSLHQKLHHLPGRMDHRAPNNQPVDVQYADRHHITPVAGGYLASILGHNERQFVNSAHVQGVDRVGKGLVVEAYAEDGTIEAISVANASKFSMGVQWHPEHRFNEHPASIAIFKALKDSLHNK